MSVRRQRDAKTVRRHCVVLVLPAVLDCRTVPGERRPILALLSRGVDVRVDMSDVHRVDTSALAMFVECVRTGSDNGATFTVVQPTEPVLRLMRLNKLDRLLTGRYARGVGPVQAEPKAVLDAGNH